MSKFVQAILDKVGKFSTPINAKNLIIEGKFTAQDFALVPNSIGAAVMHCECMQGTGRKREPKAAYDTTLTTSPPLTAPNGFFGSCLQQAYGKRYHFIKEHLIKDKRSGIVFASNYALNQAAHEPSAMTANFRHHKGILESNFTFKTLNTHPYGVYELMACFVLIDRLRHELELKPDQVHQVWYFNRFNITSDKFMSTESNYVPAYISLQQASEFLLIEKRMRELATKWSKIITPVEMVPLRPSLSAQLTLIHEFWRSHVEDKSSVS